MPTKQYFKKNFTGENPDRIYVSTKTGKTYREITDEKGHIKIDLESPLDGISLLLYDYAGENNVFKIYDLKTDHKR